MFKEKLEETGGPVIGVEEKEVDLLSPRVIEKKIFDYFANKRRKFAVLSNWASQIGHPCIRYLVYKRTEWQKEEMHSPHLQMTFDEGNLQEGVVSQLLNIIGYEVIQQQVPFRNEEYNLSGRIDGKIKVPGTRQMKLLEIKSMNPFYWAKIKSISDLDGDDFTRRYIDQMQVYMNFENEKISLIVIKNKSTGQIRVLEVAFDKKRVESLLNKAAEINAHVGNGTLPDRVEDTTHCEKCGFRAICHPDTINDPLMYYDDAEFAAMLERRQEIIDIAKEYKKIDEAIKDIAKAAEWEKFICGNFEVIRSQHKRTNYELPEEIKEKYGVKKPYYIVKINPIKQ